VHEVAEREHGRGAREDPGSAAGRRVDDVDALEERAGGRGRPRGRDGRGRRGRRAVAGGLGVAERGRDALRGHEGEAAPGAGDDGPVEHVRPERGADGALAVDEHDERPVAFLRARRTAVEERVGGDAQDLGGGDHGPEAEGDDAHEHVVEHFCRRGWVVSDDSQGSPEDATKLSTGELDEYPRRPRAAARRLPKLH